MLLLPPPPPKPPPLLLLGPKALPSSWSVGGARGHTRPTLVERAGHCRGVRGRVDVRMAPPHGVAGEEGREALDAAARGRVPSVREADERVASGTNELRRLRRRGGVGGGHGA
jgi:hypothetical protein